VEEERERETTLRKAWNPVEEIWRWHSVVEERTWQVK